MGRYYHVYVLANNGALVADRWYVFDSNYRRALDEFEWCVVCWPELRVYMVSNDDRMREYYGDKFAL